MKMADTSFKYFAYEYKKATNFGNFTYFPKSFSDFLRSQVNL